MIQLRPFKCNVCNAWCHTTRDYMPVVCMPCAEKIVAANPYVPPTTGNVSDALATKVWSA